MTAGGTRLVSACTVTSGDTTMWFGAGGGSSRWTIGRDGSYDSAHPLDEFAFATRPDGAHVSVTDVEQEVPRHPKHVTESAEHRVAHVLIPPLHSVDSRA